MRITPLEIRKHTFDRSFRGFDTESVEAFLLSLSQEWERVGEDMRQSKQKLEVAEREIIRMQEIESSLFKTLKAAEEAQDKISLKAQAEIEQLKENAKIEVEEILNEARKSAKMIISDAENKAKFLVEEAVNDLKNYERDFKTMEKYKESLVEELKQFANDTLEKVAKFEDNLSSRTNFQKIENVTEAIFPEPVAKVAVTTPVKETPLFPKEETPENDTRIDFEPANDFDDENEELPEVSKILDKKDVTVFNAKADELVKEMKTIKVKPKKLGKDDGLPTVSSVMEEFGKDNASGISNGGGSFFDDL
ncbi:MULTISPECIES: DivIVA domain-containing protein [unclassified Arcicella]|uniref:DivIVA domain-containing protein n=1 Tax=unclassified Arcicella TaxID=2644986 RepID=UPI002864575A|nr:MULTISPECIES: DivIVA domain-containing protein [unclassified Arcicella]MDR6561722.1 cell division initiation protein [Arcicella sp. BE51]MDR6812502.1 cell division initiation protein [Arcicella sp. BE140]MDR6823726.1 cell division initiation protein [Arcicella sp. BE139]